ncbi:hypothetical protein PORY_001232 [Pneumocystis oryctolagi]|uniref:Uncharacterized protein n=1 Tax=Pneumocystis oryctolagi TaxID=42067 RepID=A0ACB7CDB3_9ASCO|nr:hypothetical protein PORY_001232 [Pneumocystis oryctolagi]
MKYLFISLLLSIIALANASDFISPKEGDKLSSCSLVEWESNKDGPGIVKLLLHRPSESPPYYLLLNDSIPYGSRKERVCFPPNVIPGSGYFFLITGKNPYNVYAISPPFSILETPDKDKDCYKYLVDDGSSTMGPRPNDTVPTYTTPGHEPTTTEPTTVEPTSEPTGDCDDCENCEDDDICGECMDGEGCECDECKTITYTSYGPFTSIHSDDKDDSKGGMVDAGSMNKVTGFWLILMITITSILFL